MPKEGTPLSLDLIWSSLLTGDPGPSLTFADALLDNDMAYAAGGFLQDLAERLRDAHDSIEDEQQRKVFSEAVNQVLLHLLDNDPAALAELLDEG